MIDKQPLLYQRNGTWTLAVDCEQQCVTLEAEPLGDNKFHLRYFAQQVDQPRIEYVGVATWAELVEHGEEGWENTHAPIRSASPRLEAHFGYLKNMWWLLQKNFIPMLAPPHLPEKVTDVT